MQKSPELGIWAGKVKYRAVNCPLKTLQTPDRASAGPRIPVATLPEPASREEPRSFSARDQGLRSLDEDDLGTGRAREAKATVQNMWVGLNRVTGDGLKRCDWLYMANELVSAGEAKGAQDPGAVNNLEEHQQPPPPPPHQTSSPTQLRTQPNHLHRQPPRDHFGLHAQPSLLQPFPAQSSQPSTGGERYLARIPFAKIRLWSLGTLRRGSSRCHEDPRFLIARASDPQILRWNDKGWGNGHHHKPQAVVNVHWSDIAATIASLPARQKPDTQVSVTLSVFSNLPFSTSSLPRRT
ncbi:hypothetical protein HYFRA_00010417 [Hymenoscyphus fraxineus]|uniref:Uncharacterized protein n=1 Tax=Hymenoscyphus fraxineus TaxID=746836 RepID=A0A9N9L0L3_9HELO|nr:hypothetical protein HYFRA_00010417 [Hymenoscyphus fraxineus]